MSILAGLALSSAGLALVSRPVEAQDGGSVVHHLGVGTGLDAIGSRPPTVDEEGVGPAAIYAAPDGKVYLLDQVNGRILSMKNGESGTPESLALPADLAPQDLVAVKNRLYVWDDGVHALEARGGDKTLEARAVGDADDETRSAFAQMGSQTPSSETEVVGAAGRAATSAELGEPIRQHVASQALGAVDIEIVPRKDLKSAVVEMRPQANPLALFRFELKVAGKLGAIEVLDVVGKIGNAEAFVFAESIGAPPEAKPSARAGGKSRGKSTAESEAASAPRSGAFVLAYRTNGRLTGIYDLPITPDQYPSRRFATVTPQGKVLYLKSDASGVTIIDVSRRKPDKKGIVDVPAKAAPETIPEPSAGDERFITAIRPGTRLGAIQIGLAFEGLKWTVTPKNYGPDPDRSCVGFAGRTRRPGYLDHKVGQEVRGVPYCWGCFVSFVNFKRQVDRGVVAGNWCTREDPVRDVVGVDCSAFVSQCWGLSRQYTTADIPSITTRLADPWDLKPGDALNKAGSHVMLFVKFTPDRKVEVLESSTGGCNGRVCRNVYPLSVLLARGYQPVRYGALKDQ